ncbi:MAG: FHA domain-containing protein, partial [Planctomycetota bacterium]|nr:FHA domain-containing protein [Planctomycetota bacterium]
IQFTADGAIWKNLDCQNGTVVNGQLAGPFQAIPLKPTRRFSPANSFELSCTLCTQSAASINEAAYEKFRASLGEANPHQAFGPLSAVRINRIGNLNHMEEYVLVQKSVYLGSHTGNGVVINDPSVAMTHASILFNEHGFWLEPVQAQYPTRIDGEQIPLHRLVRLVPGMSPVQVGDVEIGVAGMEQYYLDVAPASGV